jgi:cell division protein FtsI/penicillin-binding protein 2
VETLRRSAKLAWRGRIGWCLLLLLLAPARAQEASTSLYAQATAALLNRSFSSPRVEYLLFDLRTRQTIAIRWPHAERAIPVGSLLKPFVALAYDELDELHSSSSEPAQRQFPQVHLPVVHFPIVQCRGKSQGCWRAGGHGSLTLEQALAASCNAYFLTLAKALADSGNGPDGGLTSDGLASLGRVSSAYGLPAPPTEPATGLDARRRSAMLIGVTPEWRVSPLALAHAYAALATQSRSQTANRLLNGMRLAASPGGTAARVGLHPGGVLAKTGTAPCVPDSAGNAGRCLANGDGLVVVLAPAENPNLLLLVRQRGTTGAQTAELAGEMLSRLETAHDQAR